MWPNKLIKWEIISNRIDIVQHVDVPTSSCLMVVVCIYVDADSSRHGHQSAQTLVPNEMWERESEKERERKSNSYIDNYTIQLSNGIVLYGHTVMSAF